jgi:serine/threonine protein kinase
MKTALQQICGSPYWMAPEMLQGKPYNHNADCFSFGIVLGEIAARISANPDHFPRTDDFGVDHAKLKELSHPGAVFWSLFFFTFALGHCGLRHKRSVMLSALRIQFCCAEQSHRFWCICAAD